MYATTVKSSHQLLPLSYDFFYFFHHQIYLLKEDNSSSLVEGDKLQHFMFLFSKSIYLLLFVSHVNCSVQH